LVKFYPTTVVSSAAIMIHLLFLCRKSVKKPQCPFGLHLYEVISRCRVNERSITTRQTLIKTLNYHPIELLWCEHEFNNSLYHSHTSHNDSSVSCLNTEIYALIFIVFLYEKNLLKKRLERLN
jgi:hypothetical protein